VSTCPISPGYLQWAARHPGDVQQVTEVAQRFGWSANWTRDLTRSGLALVCLTAGKTLSELWDEDFAAFAQALAAAPTAGRDAWMHNTRTIQPLDSGLPWLLSRCSPQRHSRRVLGDMRSNCTRPNGRRATRPT
jgi:hypothetical protein